MNRKEALELIKRYVKNENSIKHMLATEAIMKSLAERLNQDKEKWALAGLLHDIDMEMIKSPDKHGIMACEILQEFKIDEEILEAVKAHNEATGKEPVSLMEKAIFCTDPLTGLIVASTLVLPSKKINDLTSESVLKRFKEKAFARGARREAISRCSEINLNLDEFIELGLEAMQSISDELNL